MKDIKDKSVEELLSWIIDDDYLDEPSYRSHRAELLRRFEALEKEVDKHKRTAICMYCGTIQQTKDGQEKLAMIIEHMAVCEKHPVPKLLVDIENMKNCGNCRVPITGCITKITKSDYYCSKWQSDGLTRKEREGK